MRYKLKYCGRKEHLTLSMDWLEKPITFNKDNNWIAIVPQIEAAKLIADSPKGYRILEAYHEEEDIKEIIDNSKSKFKDTKMRLIDKYRVILDDAGIPYHKNTNLRDLGKKVDALKGIDRASK